MYRYFLDPDDYDFNQYQNCDDDRTRFMSVATGTPVLADIEGEREWRGIYTGDAWLRAVWDPVNSVYVNNLTPQQAEVAYVEWWRSEYA